MISVVKQDMSKNPDPSRLHSLEIGEKSIMSSTFSYSSGKEGFLCIFANKQIPLALLVSIVSGTTVGCFVFY